MDVINEAKITDLDTAGVEEDVDTVEPDQHPTQAWLFTCVGNGKRLTYATVDEHDTSHYPMDQWRKVTKTKLVALRAEEVIHERSYI
jgi:hypothetical protein